jgi:hypothetical protein
MPIAAFFRRPIFSDYRFILGIYAGLTLFVSIKTVFFERANNYRIFYFSLQHLLNGQSLYREYPAQYQDHYHYAPTFAALFSPVFALPFGVGLFIWHFLFAGAWAYAIWRFPFTDRQRVFAYWFGVQELYTSLVNSQTNPLMAAIPLFAFLCFERKQVFWAAFWLIVGFNIKIYGLVGAGLFLLYPQKGRFLLSMIFWGVVLAVLPVVFTTPDRLIWQYQQWISQLLIKSDVDKWVNQSIHRLVHLLISPDIPNAAIIGAGVLLFCTAYLNVRRFREPTFRWLMVASVLLFQVIFNPVAESPTYITAVTGVILWWLVCPQTPLDRALLIACFVLTILSPTDIIPKTIRTEFIRPYVLKALPCVLIWFRVLWLLHARPSGLTLTPEPGPV